VGKVTLQFDTFDTKEDRRELVILFQKLEMLIMLSMNGFNECPVAVDPAQCSPVGAYNLFVQIVGVLGVSIDEAAKLLDDCVRKKAWLVPYWEQSTLESVRGVA